MESQIDKQEYTASAQSRARDGTGGINQPSDVCGSQFTNLYLLKVFFYLGRKSYFKGLHYILLFSDNDHMRKGFVILSVCITAR